VAGGGGGITPLSPLSLPLLTVLSLLNIDVESVAGGVVVVTGAVLSSLLFVFPHEIIVNKMLKVNAPTIVFFSISLVCLDYKVMP
jgi:hypothetical protein